MAGRKMLSTGAGVIKLVSRHDQLWEMCILCRTVQSRACLKIKLAPHSLCSLPSFNIGKEHVLLDWEH